MQRQQREQQGRIPRGLQVQERYSKRLPLAVLPEPVRALRLRVQERGSPAHLHTSFSSQELLRLQVQRMRRGV